MRASATTARISALHKLVGALTFMVTLPVAYHCLWALGFQTHSARAAVHSLAGCAFYGAYAAKMTAVRRTDRSRWMIPLAGASVFALLVVVCWTGAQWYFMDVSRGQ